MEAAKASMAVLIEVLRDLGDPVALPGNYASMSIDPDQVFEIQLATLTA